ncbi:hypothetical protein [Defluviimonas salinarum]|uniref:DUF3450 domain-containing protein n=1 Tax=Defluviimonas salinarum TaxID=2992147 RepID=A0ABT3J512_9RHOB|nr:hypothetical protein [Defluviimonas salinarum]MCW3782753.1 hypothetical protein [Defluviimonas salinarum]
MRKLFPPIVLGGLLAMAGLSPAQSQTPPGLQARIDALAGEAETHGFELGMLQTLRAVEKALQTRYEYGVGQNLRMVPVFRIGPVVDINPRPKLAAPDTLSRIVETFLADLDRARATLSAAGAKAQPFELTLQDLWFDLNADGQRAAGEGAVELLAPIVLGRVGRIALQDGTLAAPITIRFDEADHAWLMAYTRMLGGFGNLFLAFDPTAALEDMARARAALAEAPEIENFYDMDQVAADIAALEAQRRDLDARLEPLEDQLKPLRERQRELVEAMHTATDETAKQALKAELDPLLEELRTLNEARNALFRDQQMIRAELESAKARLPGRDTLPKPGMEPEFDTLLVVLTALRQQPDPARLAAARDDWRAMIAENRRFWAALTAETDDDREWIPNPSQSAALPVTLPPGVAEAWQAILADAEAVLDGRLLVPHPLLPPGYGIDLSAYIEDPAPIDILEWIHGKGAYPYAAKGPRISAQSWRAFERLTAGNAGGFALYFN